MSDTVKKVVPIAAGVLGAGLLGPGGFTLGNIAAGAGLGSVAGGLMTDAPSEPAPAPAATPVVEKPRAMPTPDDEAMKRAKKRSMLAQYQRRGRASTVLSGESETLG